MEPIDFSRFKISEYFEEEINNFDIHMEQIIRNERENESLREYFETLRKIYIEKIMNIKELTIKHYDKQKADQVMQKLDMSVFMDQLGLFAFFLFKNKLLISKFREYKYGILVVSDWKLTRDEKNSIE